MSQPLCIDVFCGLGGWTEGFLAEGWECIGFDIERHDYGSGGYPAQLVLQDALTIHGKQFRQADCLVMSPPCQEYSYMAMPWSRAKAIEAEYKSGARDVKQLTALFDACFRIQREAIEAAGHFIPLVVENVRGAQKWVGRSRWNYGSYHLWGDVPALMPMTKSAMKNTGGSWFAVDPRGNRVEPNNARDDCKVPGFLFDGSGGSFQTASVLRAGEKVGDNNEYRRGGKSSPHFTAPARDDGVKGFTPNGEPMGQNVLGRLHGSKSKSRKAASAAIAKIPFALARHIAAYWKPVPCPQPILARGGVVR